MLDLPAGCAIRGLARFSQMLVPERGRRSGPSGPGQQPFRNYALRIATAARKLVALHRLCGKVGCLLRGLPPLAWQRHPLPNDCPSNLLSVHPGSPSSKKFVPSRERASAQDGLSVAKRGMSVSRRETHRHALVGWVSRIRSPRRNAPCNLRSTHPTSFRLSSINRA